MDAIDHACWAQGVDIDVRWIQAEKLEKGNLDELPTSTALSFRLVGVRGELKEKYKAINYARVNKIPYLGLCYGMQLAVVEYARNVLGFKNAHTLEIDADTQYPVIHMIKGQEEILKRRAYGGTMRLGRWE